MKRTIISTICSALSLVAMAQEVTVVHYKADNTPPPVQRAYFTSGIDGMILSTSSMAKTGQSSELTTPRFSYFFNMGTYVNFDFGRHFGMYTGLDIKNLGFIEKVKGTDSTIKRRTYNLGIPLGIKIGNLAKRNYLLIGGGIDIPFNYKEKGFVKRGDKDKFNEWFSQRTPAIMPYLFVGAHIAPGISGKIQYYPGNFLNPDFEETKENVKSTPYKGYDVHLLMVSVGFDIKHSSCHTRKNDKQ
ncbi:hypothetical protein ACTHGU_09670 [Chitinophagaceae bacterium MMS25-I14]